MERQQIIIPGLPEHLRAVPLGPTGADDPDRPQVIQNWLNWAQGVVNHRTWTWAACEGLIDGVDANRQQEICHSTISQTYSRQEPASIAR